MATGSKHLQTQTFTAASSMSAASQQFILVKQVATGVCPVTANTDIPIGVLQNSPGQGEEAEVALAGFTKIRGGGNLAAGDRIAADSTSRALAVVAGTSTGFYSVGRVLAVDGATNVGGLSSAVVDCTNPSRNA